MSNWTNSNRRGKTTNDLFEKWKETRKLTIKRIRELAKEIQESETDYRKGQVVYSSAGIVSGGLAIAGILTAPFTAGLSLGLTTTSLAVGGTSGVAGFTHYAIKSNKVSSRCEIAKRFLERDNELTTELNKHIDVVINKMDDMSSNFETIKSVVSTLNPLRGSVNNFNSAFEHARAYKNVQALKLDEAAELLNISKATKDSLKGIKTKDMLLIIDDAGVVKFAEATSKVGKEAATKGKASTKFVQIASKVALPIAIIGTVMDVLSLADNVDKLNSGKLSDHAWQLIKIADNLEDQLGECEKEMRDLPDLDYSEDFIYEPRQRTILYN